MPYSPYAHIFTTVSTILKYRFRIWYHNMQMGKLSHFFILIWVFFVGCLFWLQQRSDANICNRFLFVGVVKVESTINISIRVYIIYFVAVAARGRSTSIASTYSAHLVLILYLYNVHKIQDRTRIYLLY